VLPETTVNVTAVALDQAGTVPAGLSPARAYRVVRSWSGAPPERMLPAGVITVFVVEDVGQEPGYVMSVPGSGGAPLRMEWLHEAGRFAFGRDASMPLTAPTLVGSWSNESGIQGGVWLAGNRQWVFVGPGATLGRLATAMRLD
jgi:hypothetical protein